MDNVARKSSDCPIIGSVDTAGISPQGQDHRGSLENSRCSWPAAPGALHVALLVVDGELGRAQGDAQIASDAEESGRSVRHRHQQLDPRRRAARDAASRDAATAKANPSASRRTPQTENFDSGRLMFDYEKMFAPKLKFLSLTRRSSFLSAKSGERAENFIRSSINAGKRAAAHRHAGPSQLAEGRIDLSAEHARSLPCALLHTRENCAAHVPHLPNQKSAAALTTSASSKQLRAPYDFVGTPVRFIRASARAKRDLRRRR